MRSLRYLNLVLTVIAVLLTLQLWTMWASGPTLLTDTAVAAPSRPPSASVVRSRQAAKASGIPNAGAQRAETARQLQQLNQKADALINLFRSGQARVRIEGGLGADDKRTK